MPALSKTPPSDGNGHSPNSPDLSDLVAELEEEVSEEEEENVEAEEESVSSAEDELELSPDEEFLQEYTGEHEWAGETEMETVVGSQEFEPPLTKTPDSKEAEGVLQGQEISQRQEEPANEVLQQRSAEEEEGSAFELSDEEHGGDEWFGGVKNLISRAEAKRKVIQRRELERLQVRERLLQEKLRQQELLREQERLKQRELSVRESISFENEFEGEYLGEDSRRLPPFVRPVRVSEFDEIGRAHV